MDRENDLCRGRWQQGYRNEHRQSHRCRYDLCAVYGANGGWEADPGYHENQNETRDVTSMARYTTHSQLEKLTMLLKTLILSATTAVALFVITSDARAWGCSRSGSFSGSNGGSFSHSGSSSGGGGNYSHSGSTTATGRYGNTHSGSHSGSGSYGYGGGGYHVAYSTGGYGAYHYGGCYGGGGFHAAAVSGPYGGAYAAGVYRRAVW